MLCLLSPLLGLVLGSAAALFDLDAGLNCVLVDVLVLVLYFVFLYLRVMKDMVKERRQACFVLETIMALTEGKHERLLAIRSRVCLVSNSSCCFSRSITDKTL